MNRLADAMQRARYAVAAAWLVAALISIAAVSGAFGTKLNDLLSNRFDLPGTESEQALTLISDHFGQRTDSGYTLVFQGASSPRREHRPHPAGGARSFVRRDRHAPRAPARGAARRADAPRDRHRRGGPRVRERSGRNQPRPADRVRRRP